jgi:hypothetical protein
MAKDQKRRTIAGELTDFAKKGWNIFDQANDPQAMYSGLTKLGILAAGLEELPEGKRYWFDTFKLQRIAYQIDKDGKLIKREYADNGDIHHSDIIKILNGLQKAVEQAQHGGRRRGTRLKQTVGQYNRIINARNSRYWIARTDKDFLVAHPEFNRSQLARAKRWDAQGKPGLKTIPS